MYSLRIQVLVLVVAYYEPALEERISGAWCRGINGGKGGDQVEKRNKRLLPSHGGNYGKA
jgi:hypothetical protein